MTALEIADIVGIISFAISGFLIAVHMKLDILGIFISSFLTAFGGGMIRDVIANKTPYIFTNNLPIILVLLTIIIAIAFKLHRIPNLEGKTAFIVTDTIGLASFAISGAIIAIRADFNIIGIVLVSLLTAIGGGTLRDVVINRIPAVLISDFYGAIAIIMSFVIIATDYFYELNKISLLAIFIFGVVLRLVAYYRKWHLPTLS